MWLALAFAGTLGFGCGAGFSLAQTPPSAEPPPTPGSQPPDAPDAAVPSGSQPLVAPASEPPITPYNPPPPGSVPYGPTPPDLTPRGPAPYDPAPHEAPRGEASQRPASRPAAPKPPKARPGKANPRLRTVLRPTPARTRRTPLKEHRDHPLRKIRIPHGGPCKWLDGHSAWWCKRARAAERRNLGNRR
jgi:hypothetical protein